MLKWKVLTSLGLAFGVMGIGWGLAQERKPAGFFELRVYTALPGKRDLAMPRIRGHGVSLQDHVPRNIHNIIEPIERYACAPAWRAPRISWTVGIRVHPWLNFSCTQDPSKFCPVIS